MSDSMDEIKFCKDSQKISLKLYSIVTLFVNFKQNFHKEIETFFKNKLKWIQEICFKMNPLSSELPFHAHNWLKISLKDFCIVIRKWPTFWPSNPRLDNHSGMRIPEFSRPQRSFSWNSQIWFNIYGGREGTIDCVCLLASLTSSLSAISNTESSQVSGVGLCTTSTCTNIT